jgi:hypothetical protein
MYRINHPFENLLHDERNKNNGDVDSYNYGHDMPEPANLETFPIVRLRTNLAGSLLSATHYDLLDHQLEEQAYVHSMALPIENFIYKQPQGMFVYYICCIRIHLLFIHRFLFMLSIHCLTEVMNAKAAIRSEYARLEAPSYALGKRAKRGTIQKAASSIVTAGSTQSQVLQKSVPKKAAKTRMKAPPRTVAAKAVALKPSAKATPKHDATKAITSKAGAYNAAKSTARSRDVASMPVTNPYEESESDCKPAAIPSKKVSKPDSKPAAINRKKVSKPDSKSAATSSKMVFKPASKQASCCANNQETVESVLAPF